MACYLRRSSTLTRGVVQRSFPRWPTGRQAGAKGETGEGGAAELAKVADREAGGGKRCVQGMEGGAA